MNARQMNLWIREGGIRLQRWFWRRKAQVPREGPNPSARRDRDGYRIREGTDQRELGAGPVDSERDVIAELGERSAATGRL